MREHIFFFSFFSRESEQMHENWARLVPCALHGALLCLCLLSKSRHPSKGSKKACAVSKFCCRFAPLLLSSPFPVRLLPLPHVYTYMCICMKTVQWWESCSLYDCFYVYFLVDMILSQKNNEKLDFLSAFALFLSLSLSSKQQNTSMFPNALFRNRRSVTSSDTSDQSCVSNSNLNSNSN